MKTGGLMQVVKLSKMVKRLLNGSMLRIAYNVELWDNFSKKYGLMILVTSTNDKEVDDIGSNEILIENGEILIHE